MAAFLVLAEPEVHGVHIRLATAVLAVPLMVLTMALTARITYSDAAMVQAAVVDMMVEQAETEAQEGSLEAAVVVAVPITKAVQLHKAAQAAAESVGFGRIR